MDLAYYATVATSFIGAASIVVGSLNASIGGLERWAANTESKRDDLIVSRFAVALRVTARGLSVLSVVLSPLAIRAPKKPGA